MLSFNKDNAKPHTARERNQKFEKVKGIELLPLPPYTPNAAPSDYGLFRSMKHFLNGKMFNDINEVEAAYLELLNQNNVTGLLIRFVCFLIAGRK